MREKKNIKKIVGIEWENVITNQYPEFEDAYITRAYFANGPELTEDELEIVNDNMCDYDLDMGPYESLMN